MSSSNGNTEGTELGRFLRARRGRVRPEDAGLPAGTGIRRTPGLRREELATLAGVSVDYYTRLERGRETRPSPAVVTALGRALQLPGDAMQRLRDLAALAAHQPCGPQPIDRTVRPSVRQLLESLRPSPAYVVSRINDVLAANGPGQRLMPGMAEWPEQRRNVTRYMFLHPEARDLFREWESMAHHSVAHLRAVGGADPEQPELASLVGELAMKSPDFARIWAKYEVHARGGGAKDFRHPDVGGMSLTYEVMMLSRTDGQRLVAYQATPGSPDHDAMLLLDLSAPQDDEDASADPDARLDERTA